MPVDNTLPVIKKHKKSPGRSGLPTEIVEQAHALYVLDNLTPEEIAEYLHISKATINNWVNKKGWTKDRQLAKNQIEASIFTTHIDAIMDRRKKAFEMYNVAQDISLDALKEVDGEGVPILGFKDAASAISSLNVAIQGQQQITEEMIPLRIMEAIVEIFGQVMDEALDDDRYFKPESAQRIISEFGAKIKALGQFWASGGKAAKKMLG